MPSKGAMDLLQKTKDGVKQQAGKLTESFTAKLKEILHRHGGYGVGKPDSRPLPRSADETVEDVGSKSGGAAKQAFKLAWQAYCEGTKDAGSFSRVLDALDRAYDESPCPLNGPKVPSYALSPRFVSSLTLCRLPPHQAPLPIDVKRVLGHPGRAELAGELGRRVAACCEAILCTVGADGCDIFAEVTPRLPRIPASCCPRYPPPLLSRTRTTLAREPKPEQFALPEPSLTHTARRRPATFPTPRVAPPC